jgi:hypothetical protein
LSSDITPREIRAMLQLRVDELCRQLFPRYDITSPVFTPLNPTRPDRRPGSFVIWTRGAAAGGFNEYAPGFQDSGDVIDLIAYVHNRHKDRRFALTWARDFLGIKAMSPSERRQAAQQAKRQAALATQAQSEQTTRKIIRARKIWDKTLPIAGSAGEIYFASRRIPLMLIPNREEDLRFLPDMEWWQGAKWEADRKVAEGPHFPAIVAAVRNLAGELTAIHCTFIRADGSGKADVAKPKLMLGAVKGSFIRLTRGPSNLALEEAEACGVIEPFVTAEGIETGLSVALELREARVAAAGSFDHMMLIEVEHMRAEPIVYALDNDDNPQAEETVRDRIDALRDAGKAASFMRPSGAKDFNDVVRGT